MELLLSGCIRPILTIVAKLGRASAHTQAETVMVELGFG
jgi:hypothetical protein